MGAALQQADWQRPAGLNPGTGVSGPPAGLAGPMQARHGAHALSLWWITLLVLPVAPAVPTALLVINEVASKGSKGVCEGSDWVELWNGGQDTYDLTGCVLHDDKGAAADGALVFGALEHVRSTRAPAIMVRRSDNP